MLYRLLNRRSRARNRIGHRTKAASISGRPRQAYGRPRYNYPAYEQRRGSRSSHPTSEGIANTTINSLSLKAENLLRCKTGNRLEVDIQQWGSPDFLACTAIAPVISCPEGRTATHCPQSGFPPAGTHRSCQERGYPPCALAA